MAFTVGQCCLDQIVNNPPPPSVPGGLFLNEIIEFTNVPTLTVAWNAARIARFGDAGVFYVEILGEDGKYRLTAVEAVPNTIGGTTFYTFDFGGIASGRVIIT